MAKMGTASEAELLLYRVLQRANLTQYYETFIQQGGDDIRQLCEAGEEEFLEIMALVGMAAKPLHVRRLQKALQEWIANPLMFEKPIGPGTPPPVMAHGSIVSTVGRPQPSVYPTVRSSTPSRSDSNPTPPQGWIPNPDSRSSSPNPTGMSNITPISIEPNNISSSSGGMHCELMPGLPVYISEPAPMWKSPILINGSNGNTIDLSRSSISPTPSTDSDTNVMISGSGGSTPMQIPTLTEQQQISIETACESLANELPNYEPKPLNMKKEINREIAEVMRMSDDHPDKMSLLRKYSAIYGRFDSKRKNDSKMSLHEVYRVSVNEAAAQLCKRIPALLTRRDDLYPLSRRAVRDSGYQYSKGHSRATSSMEIPPNKKPRTDNSKKALTFITTQHEIRIAEINKEIDEIIKRQEEIKTKIVSARSNNDVVLLELLRHELEKCASRQLQLRMEQSGIVGSGRNKQVPKTKPENVTPTQMSPLAPEDAEITDGDNTGNLDDSKCKDNGDSILDLRSTDDKVHTVVKGDEVQPSESSLLDEGLRIAQQYGMCYLAEELHDMKDHTDIKDEAFDSAANSEIDEQEEWNREVERDLEKLKTPPEKQQRKSKNTEENVENGKSTDISKENTSSSDLS